VIVLAVIGLVVWFIQKNRREKHGGGKRGGVGGGGQYVAMEDQPTNALWTQNNRNTSTTPVARTTVTVPSATIASSGGYVAPSPKQVQPSNNVKFADSDETELPVFSSNGYSNNSSDNIQPAQYGGKTVIATPTYVPNSDYGGKTITSPASIPQPLTSKGAYFGDETVPLKPDEFGLDTKLNYDFAGTFSPASFGEPSSFANTFSTAYTPGGEASNRGTRPSMGSEMTFGGVTQLNIDS